MAITLPKKVFAERLKQAREQAGFKTGTAFARIIGTDPACYSNWERGYAMPHPVALVDVCKALGVTPNDLLLGLDRYRDTN